MIDGGSCLGGDAMDKEKKKYKYMEIWHLQKMFSFFFFITFSVVCSVGFSCLVYNIVSYSSDDK